jgi:hypothetical protein
MSTASPPHVTAWLRSAAVLFAACLLATWASPSSAATIGTEDLYLANANLVDPAKRQVRRGNLLIRNGMIVATPRKPPAGFTGRTLELEGKWIIPGLIDLHTHTFGNVDPSGVPTDLPRAAGVLARLPYAGVTAALDLFGAEDELFNVREQQRASKLAGADLFASLSCLTATGAHGTEYGLKPRITDTPEQARLAVIDLARRRPDVIKIIYELGSGRPSIDKATLACGFSLARTLAAWERCKVTPYTASSSGWSMRG